MRHIPNILSGLRILMIGVFIWFFAKGRYLACMMVYIAAFLTDLLDGYLARRNGWVSDLGKVLDPLADKLMLMTAVFCFYFAGWLPLYMLIVICAKELIMVVGGVVLLKREIVVYSDWFGKFAAGFFSASVVVTLLKTRPGFEVIGDFNLLLFGIAIVLAIIALVHYAKKQGIIFKSKAN